ncbi:MAG: winged helix-turn-helix transcriptional regulator [Nanohaloarchaea archaeon]|nr:winged helix-turn-helix transcriptional regulator [Candidatus Nanohaloarchaea archaeon]
MLEVLFNLKQFFLIHHQAFSCLCDKLELPVYFNISPDWFTVIFYRRLQDGGFSKTTQETAQETTQETAQEILSLINEKPTITRKELSKNIGLSEDGVKYHLTQLRQKGIIKHVGSTKKGHWIIVK